MVPKWNRLPSTNITNIALILQADNKYPLSYKVFLRPMIGRQLDSMYEMEEYLFNEAIQDINFTIVRPPRLMDYPLSGIACF